MRESLGLADKPAPQANQLRSHDQSEMLAGKLAQVILQCVRLGQSCRDGAHRVVRAADLSGHHLPEELSSCLASLVTRGRC